MFVFMFPEVQQHFKPLVLPQSVLAGRARKWGNVPRKNRAGRSEDVGGRDLAGLPDKGKPSARESAEAWGDKRNVGLWGPGFSLLNVMQGSS